MGSHPLNLAVRFLLEIAALVALGYWGWTANEGVLRFLVGIGVPLLAAVLWGTFRVPDDPGDAPVAVPGAVRLVLELAFFVAATLALFAADLVSWGLFLAVVVVIHYAVSYDRVFWLLKQTG